MNNLKSTQYHVLIDANVMRGGSALGEKIEAASTLISNVEHVDAKLLVPDLVAEEWSNAFVPQLKILIEKHAERSDLLSNFGLIDPPSIATPATEDLKKIASDTLLNFGLQTVPTDYSLISLQELIRLAIEGNPPFSSATKDKGLKDAVIGQCMAQYAQDNSELKIVFLTADKIFQEYLENLKQDKKLKNAEIFSSPGEVVEYFRLELAELNETLSHAADKLFWQPGISEGLFFKWGVEEKIDFDYTKTFPDISAIKTYFREAADTEGTSLSKLLKTDIPEYILLKKWSPKNGKGDFSIAKTLFSNRENRKLEWESTVVYSVDYDIPSTAANGVMPHESVVVHTVEYKVVWHSSLSETNAISRPALDRIEINSQSLKHVTLPDLPGFQGSSTAIDVNARLSDTLRRAFDSINTSPIVNSATTLSGLATTAIPSTSAISAVAKLAKIEPFPISKIIGPLPNISGITPSQTLLKQIADLNKNLNLTMYRLMNEKSDLKVAKIKELVELPGIAPGSEK